MKQLLVAACLLGPGLLLRASEPVKLTAPETAFLAESAKPLAPPTWRGSVAAIVYSHCASCHHTGGSGPFALSSYAQAHRWGVQMADVTTSRYMPPWLPVEGHGSFAGDRHMRGSDVAAIAAWVKAGMPQGTGAEPVAPTYSSDWQLGKPDLVLEMPQAVAVPASGTDLFMNFVLPANVKNTRWVRAMEIRPSGTQIESTSVTHHANVILDRTQSVRRDHPNTWRNGVPGMDIMVDSGDDFDPDSHFLFWKPDSTALVEPEGMPWRLDPGNDLVLNMHLKPTGKPETVRARIALYFTDRPATKRSMLLQLENDRALDIPAGTADFRIEDKLTLPVAVDVLGVYPHAHYLGRRMEAWATLPDGKRRDLILITDWDIDRQSVYRLAAPLRLPAGTTVHMRYDYDNSTANARNPNTPPVRVTAGNRSVDEMGHFWLQVLPVAAPGSKADPRVALERTWMEDRLTRSPDDEIALYNLAAIATTEGKSEEAKVLYRRLLALKPRDARTITSLGAALLTGGDWKGAQAQFRDALTADASYADAAYDLAAVDEQHDQFAEAAAVLEPVVLARPADAASQRLLAIAYATAGDPESAIPHLVAWQQLAPADADPHRALAQTYAQMGQVAASLREQKAAVTANGSNADDWNDLGVMEARAGDKAAARRSFEKALEIVPGNAAARANLAKL